MSSVTMEAIRQNPGLLDEALGRHEVLEIVSEGKVAARFVPTPEMAGRRPRNLLPASEGAFSFNHEDVKRILAEDDFR